MNAPSRAVPARCHPNVSRLERGLEDNHKEKRLSRKLVRSMKRWAASVKTARLPAMWPPRGCRIVHRGRAPECNQTHRRAPNVGENATNSHSFRREISTDLVPISTSSSQFDK